MNYKAILRENLSISHYGVDGQKWGVRNGPPYPIKRQKNKKWTVTNRSGEKKDLESSNKSIGKRDKAKIIKENIDELTIDEIKELMTRIELEEKLNKMASPEKQEGKEIASRIMGRIGTVAISSIVPLAVGYFWKKAIEE